MTSSVIYKKTMYVRRFVKSKNILTAWTYFSAFVPIIDMPYSERYLFRVAKHWVRIWQFFGSSKQKEKRLQNQNEETTFQFPLTDFTITYWNGNYRLSDVRCWFMNYFCIDWVVCMLEAFFTLYNCSEHLKYCNLNPIVFLWCLKKTQVILFV